MEKGTGLHSLCILSKLNASLCVLFIEWVTLGSRNNKCISREILQNSQRNGQEGKQLYTIRITSEMGRKQIEGKITHKKFDIGYGFVSNYLVMLFT